MAVMLLKPAKAAADAWLARFAAAAPGLEIRVWPDLGDEGEIDYAFIWDPPPGLLARLPRLKGVFSLGAGADHLFRDPDLPRDLPLTRVVDPSMTARVTEHGLTLILHLHRNMAAYGAAQRRGEWAPEPQPRAQDRPVGILGLGVLGGDLARHCAALGFPVAGWSRSAKRLDGVEGFHGTEGLAPFLARTEILVCLLPLTPETNGIMDAALFAGLPKGAMMVNLGRGAHLVTEDLIAALDAGHLAHASLDVFDPEPLPAASPLWAHPKVTITPHVAGITDPDAVVAQVIENIRRIEAGEPVLYPVDRNLGY
ncbi:MAG: glyoxylate/hydroxypyruvate reductase A [Proteobacteria bacterium]|nr:glyoxylate/hydroxypyruvate reductase A [Pseudomonadota bacterium]